MTTPQNASAQPDTGKFANITLSQPIQRGEKSIDEITLRKPRAGELRGLNLQNLISTDIVTVLQLLPRISNPVLTDDECNDLDPADLTEIGGAIRGFFMTKAELAMMDQMIKEQQPTP